MSRLAVALAVLATSLALPALASAGTRTIPVKLAFTEMGNNRDAKIKGTLTSGVAKCVAGRDIDLKGLPDAKTNSNGEFSLRFQKWQGREFPNVTATVERSGTFGSVRNQKRCAADSARLTRSLAEMTVESFSYDTPSNTFSGIVGADDPACLDELDVFLFKTNPLTGEFSPDSFNSFDNSGGAFSFTRSSDSSGTWRAVAESLPRRFEPMPNGNAVLNACLSVNSGDVTVP